MTGMPSPSRLLHFLIYAAVPLFFAQAVRAESAALEKLLAAKPTKTGLALTVSTGGCTKKTDFEIKSHRIKKRVASVEVRRVTPDACKGNFPDGMKLSFSWSELKVPNKTKILVKNPIEHSGKLTHNFRGEPARRIAMRTCHRLAAKSWQPSAWKFLRIPN
jgi:hypothetical protein